MENISRIKERCVGCKSCEQSCPKHCISMVENKEGFWYPVVDEKSCIGCKRCLKTCSAEKTDLHRNEPQHVWAWRNKNDTDIMRSASGGAADSAAKAILQMGGVVYGAAYDYQLVVSHIEVRNDAEREKIQSSKYVQSDLKDSYSKVKRRLSEGKTVLFTGTPCQIAGLYAFLGGDQPNLYTVDLICHGVPSPKFFKKYLEYKNKQAGDRVIYFNFRSKDKRGWGTQYLLKIETETETKTKNLFIDPYGKHFMDGDCYREICYQCPFANTSRVGDLTVGDFWGIAKSHPEFNSPKGVSSVFVNTEKGQQLFEKMESFAEVKQATLEDGMVKQHNLVRPSDRPITRDVFYVGIDEPEFVDRIKVGLQLKARLKTMLPSKLIQTIKKKL
ncbi:4Fe-4S dicluster domain-containing protein [Clostridium sp. MCC353]|uniref:Coenzyme F420 hydrogenase/dehydrogenase, beta subunit C-terminal domain n=1 Tax=Clostridium sp. MCC353 TaxID=2592646 RepID=UPI001C01454D|nr:Coenzyme F420 hydrogenase/dehydrogenase, beta subunit C-terminal domain [Clostridium sp. MCC353]MBT9776255.1 4Fe-4S dicluster domain-containing protein [Clostridium sp. MCC353]